MPSLQDAIRKAGIKTTAPNTTVDIEISLKHDLFQFTATTWQGREFLDANEETTQGEAFIKSPIRSQELARQATESGLNVTLNGEKLA